MSEDPQVGADRPRRRRWPWIVGGVVVLLAALAAAFWFLFVPNWRPPLRDGERHGVDVSNHQGDIDWRAVAHDDVRFAYIKATEGGDFTDAEIAGNCSRRPDRADVDAEVRAFLNVVEAAWDRQVIVYVRDDWESRYPVRDELDRPLWHARFLRRPNVKNWVIWQIHGFAHVDGIASGVDLNVMKG